MKKTATIHERIAVRAYYAWLSGSTAGAEADWLAAEQIELAHFERRAAAARKAAETRKANTASIVTIAKGRPVYAYGSDARRRQRAAAH